MTESKDKNDKKEENKKQSKKRIINGIVRGHSVNPGKNQLGQTLPLNEKEEDKKAS